MDDQNPVVNPNPGQDDQQAPVAPAADPSAPVAPAPAEGDAGVPADGGADAPAPVTPPAEDAGSNAGDVAV